jgi:putative ATP-dependent endonuclease of OLD family
LISSGFRVQIESAIKAIDGEDSIQTWIKTRDRTLLRREKTSNPECITCKQFIFADIFRDYQSTDGYDQALIDIISSSKPKYAPVIAEKLCYLDAKDFPEKIIDLFEKIKVGVGV